MSDISTYTWTTANGYDIQIEDMSTTHIINTMNAIESGRIDFVVDNGWAQDNDYREYDEDTETKEKWLKIFNDELEKRIPVLYN